MVNGLPARKFGCQGLAEKGISNLTTKWRGHYVPICTQTVSTNGQRCVRVVRGGSRETTRSLTTIPLVRSMMKRVICCNLLQNKGRRHICASALFRLSDNSQTFATLASKNNDDTNTNPTKSNDNATNSNPREVNKFSSFASNWWDARSNPLVGMNPIRIKFMTQVVNNFQPALPMQNPTDASLLHLPLHNKRVLDIGCGGGLLTESLSRLGALVVGVDASSKVVEVAKMHTFHENSMLNTTQQHQSDNQSIDLENIANIRYIGGLTVEELASEWLAEREKEDKQQQSSSPTEQLTTSVTPTVTQTQT